MPTGTRGVAFCHAARERRLTRFRTTAFMETFFETTQANRVPVPTGEMEREKSAPLTRRVGRAFLISAPVRRFFLGIYVESRARPFRRRRTSRARPVRVELRLRNPCALARLRFFG